jgi:eukaryotic-like serine/threonine-protein kinase
MVGTTIGQYRIVAPLGRGGAGTVYKAIDESLNREVAIKILNPDLADTEVMKRFRAEATTLARLNHPDIATIYELFRSETELLMVMEYVRGETLERLSMRLGPMPVERAAYIIDRILWALEHAHRAGVVHRDLKPANVMVTAVGAIKIMDFGIARVRGAEHSTAEGYMMGTPAYMAPEQVLGQEIDGRADLYSAGVVFYRLLTGVLPLTADTAIGMMQRQISDRPDPLSAHRADLPDWCQTIIDRALAKSPADRFQTAEEFRETVARATGIVTGADFAKALAAMQDHAPALSAPRMPTERIPIASGALQSASPQTRSSRAGVRGKFLTTAAVALATVAAGVAVLQYIVTRRAASQQPPAQVARESNDVILPAETARPVIQPPANPPAPPPAAEISRKAFAPLAFEARTLVTSGRRPREQDAQVVLSDGKVNVVASSDARLLHSIAYENILSISYSRTLDPMWRSPSGPAAVARVGGGTFGIFFERHWVSLRTGTGDGFVVLRLDGDVVGKVLTALEERTGRTRQLVGERRSKSIL